MSAQWDGVTRATDLNPQIARARHEVADAARDYAWDRLLGLLKTEPDLVNSTRPDGHSRYAPLHQAAHGGAPLAVIERLVELGGWRTLQNARGERPVDVARRQGHPTLLAALEPVLHRQVPIGILLTIQRHFHMVIGARAAAFRLDVSTLRLPELEPLLESRDEHVWFGVPGMYGGFNYRLAADGVEAKLITESWSRVSGGSGQRHEITSAGAILVDEGFV